MLDRTPPPLLLPTTLALALLVGLAPASPLAATTQDGVPPAATKDAATDEDAEQHERVLLLRSGRLLRADTRLEGSTWMVRSGRDWMPLPASSVAEVTRVKDLLREARKRERQLKMALPDDRADQALWLLERGLYPEALEHLEYSLRKDPDHGPSLTIVAAERLPMNLPPRPTSAPGEEAFAEQLESYLTTTARMKRASREIALQALDLPTEVLAAAFESELGRRDSSRRELAAQGLQRLVIPALAADLTSPATSAETEASAGPTENPTDRAIQALLDRSVLDGKDEVRQASARALRDLGQPAVTAPIVRALGSSSSAVRANAAEALGIVGQPVAAPALVAALAATASGGVWTPPARHIFVGRQIAYVQDYDVEAFANSVAADPQINVLTEGAVLDVRLLSIRQELARSHERAMLRGALERLTGEDFRYDAKRWAAWLEEHPLE